MSPSGATISKISSGMTRTIAGINHGLKSKKEPGPFPIKSIRMKRRIFQFLLPAISLCAAQSHSADWHTINTDNLVGAKVQYREQSRLSHFPVPVLALRRSGIASGSGEIEEIKEKTVVPVIKESLKPISAIVIESFPNRPTAIAVLVIWADGEARESSIVRSETGGYDQKLIRCSLKYRLHSYRSSPNIVE